MKVSFYLKSGLILNYEAESTPRLIMSEMSGKLLSYSISDITGNVRPLYIDPSVVDAVTVEFSEEERNSME